MSSHVQAGILPVEPPERGKNRRACFIGLAVFALAFAFYAGNSVAPVIFDDNEGLYAGAVKEMTQRGDWLLPTNNGLPRVQKPPLTYWAMLVSTSLFGMNEFAIRLPNAFFTAAWIYATFLIGLRLRDAEYGALAAAILGTMIGVFVFTHLVQPEPFLATFISLAIYCVLGALQEEKYRRRWYAWAWVCMALGSLSKGLHGAGWPLAVVVVSMIALPRQRAALKGFFHWTGPLLFFAIMAPWYLYMEWRLPGFCQAHFFREQVSAAVSAQFDRETLSIPIWMFLLQHLIFFAPWTLFIPAAAWAWRREKNPVDAERSDLWTILWIWLGVTLGTLLLSNLQDYYAMTSWGVVALWMAAAFHPAANTPRRMLGLPCVLLACAGAGLLIFAFFFNSVLAGGSQHVAPIAERDTFANALSGISLGVWESFLTLMRVAGVALLVGGCLAAWWFWRAKQRRYAALAALTLVMMALCSMATDGFRIMSPNFSLANAAHEINAGAGPDGWVACEGAPHQSSSLLFYLDRRVHWVNAPSQREFAVRVMKQGLELYPDNGQLLAMWNSPRRVFLIVEDGRLEDWQLTLSASAHPPRLLLKDGTRQVLVNY